MGSAPFTIAVLSRIEPFVSIGVMHTMAQRLLEKRRMGVIRVTFGEHLQGSPVS